MADSFRTTLVLLLAIGMVSGPLSAQQAKPGPVAAKPERKTRRFSSTIGSLPDELQFSDFGFDDEDETKYGKILTNGQPNEQIVAARVLWEGHSRIQASNILKFLAGPPPGGDEFRKLQRDVEASLQPQVILHELKEGDYLWGCWLAFLRPHKDYVPALLAGLKDDPKMLSATALALGNSGDPRAREPLVELLKSKDNEPAMYGALGLGYLGTAEAELIDALARKDDLVKTLACRALEQTGSAKALQALEKLAKDDRNTGYVALQRAAITAIQSIKKREKK